MNPLEFLVTLARQPRTLWCHTYQTWMPHVQTPSGEWVCACGEVAEEDLGTRTIVSGGEVLELGKQTGSDELPF